MYEPSTDFFSSDPLSLEAPSDQTCCVEQSEKGMLDGRIHFGRSGVNMLWVIEADEWSIFIATFSFWRKPAVRTLAKSKENRVKRYYEKYILKTHFKF